MATWNSILPHLVRFDLSLFSVLVHLDLGNFFYTSSNLVLVYTIGNATERSIDSATVCLPGLDLKVRVRTVNQAENGDFLLGPWSIDGEYQCKPEGISDGRLHITIEVVHVHRFELVPPLYPYVGWSPQGDLPPPPQNVFYNQQAPALPWNPYYPWYPYHPSLSAVPAQRRQMANVVASFGRKKNSRIKHPWWWFCIPALLWGETSICNDWIIFRGGSHSLVQLVPLIQSFPCVAILSYSFGACIAT